jgi:hypothetical protein
MSWGSLAGFAKWAESSALSSRSTRSGPRIDRDTKLAVARRYRAAGSWARATILRISPRSRRTPRPGQGHQAPSAGQAVRLIIAGAVQVVRVRRWRRTIESGEAKSITDLAEQESVTDAYVCRLLPLTCLAPDIVEAILDGRQPKGLRLAEMLGNGPSAWNTQRQRLGFSNGGDPDGLLEPHVSDPP